MQSVYLQRIMKKNANMGTKKQTQFKPNNQSPLITNHLEGKPNSKPIKANSKAKLKKRDCICLF